MRDPGSTAGSNAETTPLAGVRSAVFPFSRLCMYGSRSETTMIWHPGSCSVRTSCSLPGDQPILSALGLAPSPRSRGGVCHAFSNGNGNILVIGTWAGIGFAFWMGCVAPRPLGRAPSTRVPPRVYESAVGVISDGALRLGVPFAEAIP